MQQQQQQQHLPSEIGPLCPCGLYSSLKTVIKDNENKGRGFYTCSKNKDQNPCNFFQWADGQESKVPRAKKGANRRRPLTPPIDPPKKLARANACPDLGAAINQTMSIQSAVQAVAATSPCVYDQKMAQLNTANFQMLVRAIEQNTLVLKTLLDFLQDVKKDAKVAPCTTSSSSSDEECPNKNNTISI